VSYWRNAVANLAGRGLQSHECPMGLLLQRVESQQVPRCCNRLLAPFQAEKLLQRTDLQIAHPLAFLEKPFLEGSIADPDSLQQIAGIEPHRPAQLLEAVACGQTLENQSVDLDRCRVESDPILFLDQRGRLVRSQRPAELRQCL